MISKILKKAVVFGTKEPNVYPKISRCTITPPPALTTDMRQDESMLPNSDQTIGMLQLKLRLNIPGNVFLIFCCPSLCKL